MCQLLDWVATESNQSFADGVRVWTHVGLDDIELSTLSCLGQLVMWEHAYGDYVGERSSPEIGSTHAWCADRVEGRGGE